MKFTNSEVERLSFQNISDVGLQDDDSGLHLFRGMISPWDSIKSFRETFKFLSRHSAMLATASINALQIMEPDQETRQGLMSTWWKNDMLETWGPEDVKGQVKSFEENYSIPPFMKRTMYRQANYADWGDEMMLMPGKVRYATTDHVEKEVHGCNLAIAGPDACDLSEGGGQWFCKGLYSQGDGAGYEDDNLYLVQRIGCGDGVCRVVWENAKKFGEHRNHNAEMNGHDWEEWGPPASGYEEGHAPIKDEVEYLTTGYFTAALGQEFTAGEMFQMMANWALPYTNQPIEAMRIRGDGEISESDWYIYKVMLDTAGKMQFGEEVTKKAIREWMGVPSDIDDGRVMGAYISMLWQARAMEWTFAKFEEDEVIIDCDSSHLFMYGMYPEILDIYEALFNGMVKTLVSPAWVVEADREYLEEEDQVRYIIKKAVYGNRRQKPGYDYDRTEENKRKLEEHNAAIAKIKAIR